MFGLDGDMLSFDIFVHFGTLLAVLVVFRQRIFALAAAAFRAGADVVSRRATLRTSWAARPELRTVAAILIGSVPAGVIGIAFKDGIERLFSSPGPVLVALAVTGIFLLLTFLACPGSARVGIGRGLLIGIVQAVAIIPGISRSGSTIAAALFLRTERGEAGEFSFLLSIPAVAGATILALRDLSGSGIGIPAGAILLGTGAAFVSGVASLMLLMRIVKTGKIGWFGFYCLAVAVAGGLYTALR